MKCLDQKIMKYRLGVSVIIVSLDKVLIGKRLSKNGFGLFSFPGGHVHDGVS